MDKHLRKLAVPMDRQGIHYPSKKNHRLADSQDMTERRILEVESDTEAVNQILAVDMLAVSRSHCLQTLI